MDSRRLAYLNALEIDVWERRDLEPVSGGQRTADSDNPQTAQSPSTYPAGPRRSVAEQQQNTQASAPELNVERIAGSPGENRSLADVATLDWEALTAAVRACTLCPLHETRTQAVFGVGDRRAEWMIIGEAPGVDEDRQGEPFVGRAGQLLNAMLKAVGLRREQVFIANILKSHPPNNRDPRPEEVRACIPYLYRQIELIDPKVILCVGRIAAQTLLQTDTPIGKLRGRLHRIASDRPMIVTYHPAYLLRSPGEKRKAWSDLLLAVQTLESVRARSEG